MTTAGKKISRRLEITSAYLNLTFHDIVDANTHRGNPSPFDITESALWDLIDWMARDDIAPRTRLYFDDNHASFYERVMPRIDVGRFAAVAVAVPTATIGEEGRGSDDDIGQARHLRVRLLPHGHNHVRLASYTPNGQLLGTPAAGEYQPREDEGERPLTENEVLFQLVEAYERLPAGEFVLPYGAYNRVTIGLNAKLQLYRHLSTADFSFDRGQHLRPRLLVRADSASPDAITDLVERAGR